jgi:hypothetical protein
MKEHPPLPVSGYTIHSDERIGIDNTNKETEERLLRRLDMLSKADGIDGYWLGVARVYLELGFMAMNRAVFQPQRAKLPEDAEKSL